MKKFGILFAALIMMATSASAQNVTVRSGEHDGYTRLVLNVPPNTGWTLEQRKNGARLRLALDAATFQTSAVFSRLTTNRLASISQPEPGGALELEFGCACAASAFLYRDSMIVLDIAPGAFLPPLLVDIPPPVKRTAKKATTESYKDAQLAALDLPLLEHGLKDQLSTRFLQGADRRLLGLNLTPVGPRSSAPPDAARLPTGLSGNIRLTSVLDDLQDVLNAELQQFDNKPTCITTSELGFAHWSGDEPFSAQVSALRTGLFKEFDRIDENKALRLAKLYAFNGFGAEALAALALSEAPSEELDRIEFVAQLVDDKPIKPPHPFSGLQRCDSDAALWAVLSEGTLAPDADVEAIEQAYGSLPNHLRRQFGKRLSEILVNAQQLEAARRVIRSVDRIEQSTSASTAHAKAIVAAAEGNDVREEELLTEVVSSPKATPNAPVALARLVEKRWGERSAVTSKELELAASFAVEYRRSNLGPMMARTHAIALSLSQDFEPAFDIILNLPNGQDRTRAFNRHFHLLSERSDNVTFLRQAFHVMQMSKTPALSTDSAIAVGDRLAALGFADQAIDLTNRAEDQTHKTERARVRAKAALLSGRPHKALMELDEDKSDEARALRAQALGRISDFAAAAEIMKDLGQGEAANRLYWLAGLPDDTVEPQGGKYAVLNQTTQALLDTPARQLEKPLMDAEGLLENSETTRERIIEMLNAVNLK
ncbi:hypothetical protein [Ruegeria sp. HKCCA5763]|uniref:hypothetical protein n=1 Tax=Ruegeria sp. HKCCA5763 TaxID=2682987 RepID=UPI001488ADBD|nr:hypothetical protein [Ruegeria sp. HKCCA5763]